MTASWTRRTWLQASTGMAAIGGGLLPAAGAWMAGAEAAEPATGGEKPLDAIDAHTHFYDPTRPQGVPWPARDDKVLYRKVLPEEFRELAAPLGVRRTIVVEASPWLEDNQWLLDLAARQPAIAGVVGRLNVAEAEFAKHLEGFAANARFRGIRVNHADLRRALDDAEQLARLRRLAKLDLTLDVNGGPDMPGDVARLAKALPDLRIVINHAANVPIDGRAVPADWLRGLRAAAGGERVYCKVSALVEGARRQAKDGKDAPAGVAFYRPVLDALWETFGGDRLVFGSNWPVSARYASYAVLHGIVRAYFAERGAAAAEKYFRTNALAAYKPPGT